MKTILTAGTTALALFAAQPGQADEITDTLQSAIEAYESGDVQYAIEELDYARQQLLSMKTDALGGFLPDAPDGWTREVNSDMNAGLAMMGGGVGAEATYSGPGGERFKITLMADNPMVASMAAMVNNAAMMGMKVERIGRQKFAIKDDEIMGLVANRVLVRAEDGELAQMLEALKTIDFAGLGNFGS